MSTANHSDRSFIAKLALVLFVFGLVAPPALILLIRALATINTDRIVPPAAVLFLVAELLALVLGIIGRRHVAGRIAWIGVTILLVLNLAYGLLRWRLKPGSSSPGAPAPTRNSPDKQGALI